MTIFSPDPPARDTLGNMTPADAAAEVRAWFKEHVSTIERALAWYGVRSVQDRADLTQDVLMTGYLALVRGERIEIPRAWLRDCARKHASNYRRKAIRRAHSTGHQVVNTMPTPEQIVEHRELLLRLFELIDKDAEGIIFDARVDEMTWEQIAAERGISVDQARYQLRRALEKLEAALENDDSTPKERLSFALPVAMDSVFEAIRAEADSVSPEVRRRTWESLEQRMNAAAGAGEPGEQASSQRPSPDSIQIAAAPVASISTGAIAGMVGGGVVLGIILGYLAHGALPAEPPSAPTRPGASLVLVRGESASGSGSLVVPARPLVATEAAEIPGEWSTSLRPKARSMSAASPAKAASMVAPTMLLEQARASFAVGDVQTALALLTSSGSRSLRGREVEGHRKLLLRICATSAARGARECADAESSAALK